MLDTRHRTRTRFFHDHLGVEGDHWYVEYEPLPNKWFTVTLPFNSEAAAETWRREYCPSPDGWPGDHSG